MDRRQGQRCARHYEPMSSHLWDVELPSKANLTQLPGGSTVCSFLARASALHEVCVLQRVDDPTPRESAEQKGLALKYLCHGRHVEAGMAPDLTALGHVRGFQCLDLSNSNPWAN